MLGLVVPGLYLPQVLSRDQSSLATPILQKLGTFGPLRCQEAWALERLLREARVLEAVCELSRRWGTSATSAQEGKDPVDLGYSYGPEVLLCPSCLHACLPCC